MGNGCTTFAALCMFDKRVGCTLFILETWRMHTHTNTHTHTHTHTHTYTHSHTHMNIEKLAYPKMLVRMHA